MAETERYAGVGQGELAGREAAAMVVGEEGAAEQGWSAARREDGFAFA